VTRGAQAPPIQGASKLTYPAVTWVGALAPRIHGASNEVYPAWVEAGAEIPSGKRGLRMDPATSGNASDGLSSRIHGQIPRVGRSHVILFEDSEGCSGYTESVADESHGV
jgi:hypothetical protein